MELTEQEIQHCAKTLETVEKALLDGNLKSLLLTANLGEISCHILLGNVMDSSIAISHILRKHGKEIMFIYETANTLNKLLNENI